MNFNRYATPVMQDVWHGFRKRLYWKELWLALMESQAKLGLTGKDGKPRISEAQIECMRKCVTSAKKDDHELEESCIQREEKICKHDVMACIRYLGHKYPEIRGELHLGATSCYITDNSEMLLMRDAMDVIQVKLVGLIDALAKFASKYIDMPTLGYTHFQPAQLTTVGKRASLWLSDFVNDFEELNHRRARISFRGVKGATGTQASFLELFDGDTQKVKNLERMVANQMGFLNTLPITGQTYSRKHDSQIVSVLGWIAESANKFATDLRLLQHEREIMEPFAKTQVGSSAMPYKRNPMKCERICSLARFVINGIGNCADTSANQWLERTLDDSANRRLVLPSLFLAADAILALCIEVANGMEVNEIVVAKNVRRELPFLACENFMMEAVKEGHDRQEVHEKIRKLSLKARMALDSGKDCQLEYDLLAEFPGLALNLTPKDHIGRSVEQVKDYLMDVVGPILKMYRSYTDQHCESQV